ncbi:MAG: nuclear transport factor 2 family protein [bacterium]
MDPVKVEPIKSEPVKPALNDAEEVLKAVRQWAAAWSRQDINAYLGAYGKDFKPPKGLTRAQWEAERRARINGRSKIRVEILQPKVTISGDSAKVSFRQNYESDSLQTTTRKTLNLSRHGGRWVIVAELAGV